MYEPLTSVLNDVLKVEAIEKAFNCFLVHRPEKEATKIAVWQQELSNVFQNINPDQLDLALRQYFSVVSGCSYSHMRLLMELLENIVMNRILPARKVCEMIITSEILVYSNSQFWIECFNLVKKTIELVEYKGVREIMKVCLYQKCFIHYAITFL